MLKYGLRITVGTVLVAAICAAFAQLEDFAPVTTETLETPSPADWIMSRATYNGWGHSPLDQINRENVGRLILAWSRAMNEGPNEGTPLVYNGVMYLPHPNDVIQALDATTGDLIWEYRRELPTDVSRTIIGSIGNITRNVAIYEDKIFHSTYDAHVIALDARTGQLVWETSVGDLEVLGQTVGPLVVNGKAISGRACDPALPGGCYITAHDVETGEELWRTFTIPRPGEPGGDTWGDLPPESRLHVGTWGHVGAYDPDLNLIYWGTSVPAPSPEILRGSGDGDMLYSNSTLAMNPDTGEIVWYFQHLPRDNWDLDHPFERMLIDSVIDPNPDAVLAIGETVMPGQVYKTMTNIPGKTGVVFSLNRETGDLLYAKETVRQNVISAIEPNGRVIVNEDVIPDSIDDPYGLVCPTAVGGRDWQAGAYNPETNAIYTPMQNLCMEPYITTDEPTPEDLYALDFNYVLLPDNDNIGRLEAVSVETGETLWKYEQRAALQPALSTGGGLIFNGDVNRRFRAHDAATGEVLWETIVSGGAAGHPISYGVDGEQYIAIAVGGGLIDGLYISLTPELEAPSGSNAIFVFKLP